jgi:uncharacterized membrane protein HdeD (DUF308 family)
MTIYSTGTTAISAPPKWVRVLLGLVLILAGLFVLGDVVLATLISTIFIGIMALVAGAFEIVHAFWTKGWGGFLWQLLLGALYVGAGLVLLSEPVSGALILTYVLGLMLVISGFVRAALSFRHWEGAGWIMLLSGIIGVLAGFVILSGFPATGLWVLGFVLGVDLIMHGAAWFAYAWLAPAPRAA